ncbi:DUF724 domain-containing protein 3 [Brassica napus]|uniref:DUF724 domain-containing protein 3 n=1 Tax=Brassica napus TaxID=3708 RepID=UPI0006AB6879|nr:DUF724 domain-containing protein 3 [Brassica napus]
MKKCDEIEVSSNEQGLKGSWFRAILETSVSVYGNIRIHHQICSRSRQHFDRVGRVWDRPRKKRFLYKTLTFSCGTMVEVNDTDDDDDEVDLWVPSVIVKVMKDKKSFVVKPFKRINWDDGETLKPNRTVGLNSIRLTPVHVSVEKSYGLMESVEVFLEPGWHSGTVTSILCENRYTVCLNATNESLVFKHDALRPSGESITTLVLQDTSEVNAAITPQMSLVSVNFKLNLFHL